MNSHRKETSRGVRFARARGFTLIEAIVVVVIIGVLAAVIGPRLLSRVGQSKRAVAEANAAALATGLKTFMLDHSAPPDGSTIDILWERPSSVDEAKWEPYVDSADKLKDPWGNKYVLVIPGQKNFDFDIVSYGADGKPGGEGDAADIVKP
jgi:general secretion pathway protein G